jgi:acyl-CoA reductase-like NAD-dependent aldehyde dehydrogenase
LSVGDPVLPDTEVGPLNRSGEVERVQQWVTEAVTAGATRVTGGVPWSFQAVVFSQDIDAAMTAAERLNGAAAMVNDHTAFRVDWMPFGGRGPSGLGTGGIGHSVRDMPEQKLVVLRRKE